ncbi:MAG: YifB family Mg chelatase-like AAA ATPase [Syntrophomonadaceae bacterium]|nr:YifB family Mg chelatase-like AAA ATPase [Syntrophomonadaceae bacterium]
MLARVASLGLLGLEGYPVQVEVDVSNGLPAFDLVGLPSTAVRESRERVRSAIRNAGFDFPLQRITVNLAPADLRKEGPAYDLPIALGILAATEQIPLNKLEDAFWAGELSLDGQIRGISGVLAMAFRVKNESKRAGRSLSFITPLENAEEAALIADIQVYGVKHLSEVVAGLRGDQELSRISSSLSDIVPLARKSRMARLDFNQVKGQQSTKRALEVAAAGGHNLLLMGPPGAGKTMLVRRFPTILPSLTFDECLDITRIYSVAGFLPRGQAVITERPFRTPHHTCSAVTLVGGGRDPRPGEVSLAHRGVLFMDELLEFNRGSLEALRQPLEDGQITVSRLNNTFTFPCRFVLIGSMNPCPCGFLGDGERECVCTPPQIKRYRQRLSGPLLDRFDLHVEVPRLNFDELEAGIKGESSETIQARVEEARNRQRKRLQDCGIMSNAEMNGTELEQFCNLQVEGRHLLQSAFEKLGLSVRAYHRILRVARTIADLAGSSQIQIDHLAEAIQYRVLDRNQWD